MIALQLESIVSNLLFSVGIFFLISSEAKIGSRYIQPLQTLIMKSIVSWIKIIFPSINLTYFSIFFSLAIGDAFIMSKRLSWSSRIYQISSVPLTVKVPVYLQGKHSRSRTLTFSSISFNFFSSVHYFSALLDTSSITPLALAESKFISISFSSVISSLGSNFFSSYFSYYFN